jgi:hypothetical protein
MLDNLNEYLKNEMSDDYWYDSALFVCEDILKGFSDDEWKELLKTIPSESVEWKKRLVKCLGSLNSPHEIDCIIMMLSTENEDLFIACIDSLRNIDISPLQDDVKKSIVKRVEDLIRENSSPPVKKILKDFLNLIA